MDLVQLEYFKTVAECEHLTNAAKKLNVAQPTLSVSLSRLENEVGVPLFNRVGRGIYLNKCGEIYLEYVNQVLNLLKRAQDEVDRYADRMNSILNLGIVNKPFSQTLVMDMKQKYPEIKIHQINVNPADVETELEAETIDLVITNCISHDPEIISEAIHRERLFLAVAANDPLAAYDWIRLIDAEKHNFISLPKQYEYRMVTDKICEEAGFTPKVTVECYHCQFPEMLMSGKGAALMTESRIKAYAGSNLIKFISIEDPIPYITYYAAWKAGRHLNKMTRDFLKFLKSHYDEHSQDACNNCSW